MLNSRQLGRTFGDSDIVRARTLGDLSSLALRRVRLLEEEREAKEKAEAALRVRDETIGIVSHDLRNPLTRIALCAQKRQTIVCRIDSALPDVCADRDRLVQVFSNLVSNAMKFTPQNAPGGGAVFSFTIPSASQWNPFSRP